MNTSTLKNKITYIIGAGASANALPVVRRVGNSTSYSLALRELATKLESTECEERFTEFKLLFISNLNWLADKSDESGTPDTFAKQCSLNGQMEELLRIKKTLSLFFVYQQFLEKKVDNRYLNFITRALDNLGMFPENISIVNWNYDFQFQLASWKYRAERFSYVNSVTTNSIPLIPYYPAIGNEFHVNYEEEKCKYNLIHLNGIAGFYHYVQNNFIQNYFLNDSLKCCVQLISATLPFSRENTSFGVK